MLPEWVLLGCSYGFKCVYVAQVLREEDCGVWVCFPRNPEAVWMAKPDFYRRLRRTIHKPACV